MVKQAWDVLKMQYEMHSKMFTIDLQKKLQETQCEEGGDVRTHFTTMQALKEDLAALGVTIDNEEFVAMLLGSLLKTYGTFLSVITVALKVLGQPLNLEALI